MLRSMTITRSLPSRVGALDLEVAVPEPQVDLLDDGDSVHLCDHGGVFLQSAVRPASATTGGSTTIAGSGMTAGSGTMY